MIHVIIGTRAQLIKTAPILVELQKRKSNYNFIFVAQHKETMKSMMQQFGIKHPDIVLGNMGKDITKVSEIIPWFIKIIIKTLLKREKIFKKDKNGVVLVHGDAPPALLGVIMAKIGRLKVAHVEAGLRSGNLLNPFPEEIIRVLVGKIADIHFCPNETAIQNLNEEWGVKGRKINTKANTLYDSLNLALKMQSDVDIPKEKFAIASIHRFETISHKETFSEIIEIIEEASKVVKILFVLHPSTREYLKRFNLEKRLLLNKNIELKRRYNYIDFVKLVNKSEFLLTDGGSNQEESFYLGLPCLILRKITERQEGVGKNVVVSKLNRQIINKFLEDYNSFRQKPKFIQKSPTKMIVDFLIKCQNAGQEEIADYWAWWGNF